MLLLLIKVQTNFLQALHTTALPRLKNKNEQQISYAQDNHIAEGNLASPKTVSKQKAGVCVREQQGVSMTETELLCAEQQDTRIVDLILSKATEAWGSRTAGMQE